MRKKVLGISLAVLFFGSITTSTFATPVVDNVNYSVVDDDNKKKTKAKKSKSKDYQTKTECCESAKAKSCDDKKGSEKR